jgi:hypothetical protein
MHSSNTLHSLKPKPPSKPSMARSCSIRQSQLTTRLCDRHQKRRERLEEVAEDLQGPREVAAGVVAAVVVPVARGDETDREVQTRIMTESKVKKTAVHAGKLH